MKVLVLDDSAMMRAVVRETLEELLDAEVMEAADGRAGVELLSLNLDVIVCDWNMPIMDGLEFLRTARESGCETPFLMVSADSELSLQGHEAREGVIDFMSKPFLGEDLAARVASLAEVATT